MNVPDWHADAACKGHPTDWWFPDIGENGSKAIAICRLCPVLEECDAASRDENYGIWAGRGRRARQRIRGRGESSHSLALAAMRTTPNAWLSARAVANRSGVPPEQIGRALLRLRQQGLVEHHREGHVWRVAPEVT